jgi:hypothetical protein
MFNVWQALQRARNCPINGLNSSARLARLALFDTSHSLRTARVYSSPGFS